MRAALPVLRDEGLAADNEAHVLLLGSEVIVRDGRRPAAVVLAQVAEPVLVGPHVHVQRLGAVEERAALTVPVREQRIELFVESGGIRETLPWTAESTELLVGTVALSGARTDYDLANGTRRVQMSCSPRTYNDVRPATARLLASAGDCRDPRGRWEPPTTERVSGIGCSHTEGDPSAPTDAPPLDFTAAPGIE